jgi:hypothetical protein
LRSSTIKTQIPPGCHRPPLLSSDGGTTKSLSFSLTNQYFNLGWGVAKFRAGEDGTLEFQSGGTDFCRWADLG